MLNELSEFNLSAHRQVKKGVRLHLRIESLRVLMILVHVLIFELLRIVLVILLCLDLGNASHVIDIFKVGCRLDHFSIYFSNLNF